MNMVGEMEGEGKEGGQYTYLDPDIVGGGEGRERRRGSGCDLLDFGRGSAGGGGKFDGGGLIITRSHFPRQVAPVKVPRTAIVSLEVIPYLN